MKPPEISSLGKEEPWDGSIVLLERVKAERKEVESELKRTVLFTINYYGIGTADVESSDKEYLHMSSNFPTPRVAGLSIHHVRLFRSLLRRNSCAKHSLAETVRINKNDSIK